MIERNAHQDPEPTSTCTVSRRSVLAAFGATLIGGLAGCSGSDPSSTATGSPTASPTPTADSVFEEINVAGQNMVVTLASDHRVERLNLVAPDGELYTQSDVARGVTTVRLGILDIQPGVGAYDHYTPGTYELVAVTEESTQSRELELQPDLRLTGVEQYVEDGNRGNLAITIRNDGTASTWPYQIVYRNAPNEAANSDLNDQRGVPQFVHPDDPGDSLLSPGESASYVGNTPPIVFTDQDQTEQACRGQREEFTVVVGTAVGSPLERRLEISLSGERSGIGVSDTYTCTEITAQLLNGGDDDA